MTTFDRIILLLTGLTAIYMLWHFYARYQKDNALYDIYYLLGFGVLLVSGLLLIFFGWDILASPYVLTVATLIPLGISMGLMNQFQPKYKKAYSWFALVGLLAIALTSIAGLGLKKLAVPIFHGVAGLIIFLLPFFAQNTKPGFWLVGIGGALIGLGGIALAFLVSGSQLLFFSQEFVFMILAPLLFLMTLAFTFGFRKNIGSL
jgi:hypothetical protein